MKPTRRIAAETTTCALLAALAACGAPSTIPPPASPASPTAVATTSPVSVAEDLVFTGAISGHVTSGSAGDAFECQAAGSGSYAAGPILGSLAGRQVEMNVTILNFSGSGDYSASGVTFDVGTDHYYAPTGAPGTLTIATDLKSGTVDMALAVNTSPNGGIAHVTGSWRCPPTGP